MEKQTKEIQISGTPGLVQPVYADAIQLGLVVKETMDKKERVGMMRFTFMDMIRGQVLTEIVIDHLHARELLNVLQTNVKKLDEAVKTGKSFATEQTATKLDTTYIR